MQENSEFGIRNSEAEEGRTPETAEMTEEEAQRIAEANAAKREELRLQAEAERKRLQEALEAMSEGRGSLELLTPLHAGDREIAALPYDFTELSGTEYADAMDAGPSAAASLGSLSYRQALSLFAAAAARQVEGLDRRDILEQLSAQDAAEGVELAGIFFAASIRAGRKRISKK